MSSQQLEHLSPRIAMAPGAASQGTLIEQSRAVAEAQAAVIVAQQCPRNVSRAIEEMRESCRRKELADRAFFRYPQGGQMVTGPSIHLARELARIWGNFSYGLTELSRNEIQSEMLAYAYDLQTNARNQSIVINPHRGYTGGKELTSLREVYENNTNVGARRVREAILASLPTWFVEEAKDLCSKTIAQGDGLPLATRIANAIEVFGNMGITVPQLETKIGMPTAKWGDHDVAQLRIIRQALLRGETNKDDEFPPARLSAEDIIRQPAQPAAAKPAEAPAAGAASTPTAEPEKPKRGGTGAARLGQMIAQLIPGTPDDLGVFLTWRAGRSVAKLADLSRDEVDAACAYLDDMLQLVHGDTGAAATNIWQQVAEAQVDAAR
jgi:hypothetical protein